MKWLIEGKEYSYDGKLTVKDSRFIHEKSGVGVGRLNHELLVEGNPNVIAAWIFLLKRQAGEAVRWDDIDHVDIVDFRPVPDEDEPAKDDEGASEAPDPTSSTGKTRKRGTTNT